MKKSKAERIREVVLAMESGQEFTCLDIVETLKKTEYTLYSSCAKRRGGDAPTVYKVGSALSLECKDICKRIGVGLYLRL